MSASLLWLDLETTGLDPRRDLILEIAYGVATFDDPFVLVAPIRDRVFEGTFAPWTEQVVIDMHTKNGLWADCLAAYGSPEGYDAVLASELSSLDGDVVLAGSTIHFDKAFLARWMPKTHALLSHRLYDVSAIELFCQSLGMPKPAKAEAHRAKADVLESIAHAKACAEWLGKVTP